MHTNVGSVLVVKTVGILMTQSKINPKLQEVDQRHRVVEAVVEEGVAGAEEAGQTK